MTGSFRQGIRSTTTANNILKGYILITIFYLQKKVAAIHSNLDEGYKLNE